MSRQRFCVYKVQTKYKKAPEVFEKYGFFPYKIDEESGFIYAKKIVLSDKSPIFLKLKRSLEKFYLEATTKERETEFKSFKFKEILTPDQKRGYELVVTKKIKKELSECQLCFYTAEEASWILFINSPNKIEYYNSQVLDEHVKEIIEEMLKDKVIYLSKIKVRK